MQNNLSELWSLLNFLLPDAFADLEHFENMFDFSDIQDKEGHKQFITQERKKKTVASLHAILKPFLLRRVKADVETHLPKKREYILYAPLTAIQKELYRKIKEGDIRSYLEEKAVERISGDKAENQKLTLLRGMKRKAENENAAPNKSAKSSRSSTPASSARSGRKGIKRRTYAEVSDREYFKQIGESSESEVDLEEQEEQEREKTLSLASKSLYLEYHLTLTNLRERGIPQKAPKPHYATPPGMQQPTPLLLALAPGRRPRLDSHYGLGQNVTSRPSGSASHASGPQNHSFQSILQTA